MTKNMTVMQYASKFTKLSRLVLDLIVFEMIKMTSFEEGLDFYIRNQ